MDVKRAILTDFHSRAVAAVIVSQFTSPNWQQHTLSARVRKLPQVYAFPPYYEKGRELLNKALKLMEQQEQKLHEMYLAGVVFDSQLVTDAYMFATANLRKAIYEQTLKEEVTPYLKPWFDLRTALSIAFSHINFEYPKKNNHQDQGAEII